MNVSIDSERARVRIISSRKEKKQGLCCVKFRAKLPESFKHHLQYVSICRPHLKALFVVLSLSPTSSFKSHLTVLVWLSRRRCLERGQGIICITADELHSAILLMGLVSTVVWELVTRVR